MDKDKKQNDKLQEQSTSKSASSLTKSASKKLLISGLIFVALLVLVVFVQKPQIITQNAASGTQTSTSATADCSPVPFYCLILPGSRNPICTRPRVCPTQPPTAGFVAQSNPIPKPVPASSSATPASNSANLCLPIPANLDQLTIHFGTDVGTTNGYTIRAVDMPALNNYATTLKNYPNATVTIIGYTDSVPFAPGTPGPINNNQALSLARAQAAVNYLKSKGATKNKYVAEGKGATNFVAPNNPQTGNILNRRAEITTDINTQKCTTPTKTLTCTDNNGNWGFGGYFFKPPTTANSLSLNTQWNVVATKCSAKAVGFSVWPGIQSNDLLVQAGSYASCPPNAGPTLRYFPWTIAYPRPFIDPPAVDTIVPNDTMYASITMTSKGKFVTVLEDKTRGWSYTVNTTDNAYKALVQDAGQILIEDEGGQQNPLVPFNPVNTSFANSQYSINGSVSSYVVNAPGLTCNNMARNGTILDQVSSITGGNFTQTWKHL